MAEYNTCTLFMFDSSLWPILLCVCSHSGFFFSLFTSSVLRRSGEIVFLWRWMSTSKKIEILCCWCFVFCFVTKEIIHKNLSMQFFCQKFLQPLIQIYLLGIIEKCCFSLFVAHLAVGKRLSITVRLLFYSVLTVSLCSFLA